MYSVQVTLPYGNDELLQQAKTYFKKKKHAFNVQIFETQSSSIVLQLLCPDKTLNTILTQLEGFG